METERPVRGPGLRKQRLKLPQQWRRWEGGEGTLCCISEVVLTDFANGWNNECEGKRGAKDNAKVLASALGRSRSAICTSG